MRNVPSAAMTAVAIPHGQREHVHVVEYGEGFTDSLLECNGSIFSIGVMLFSGEHVFAAPAYVRPVRAVQPVPDALPSNVLPFVPRQAPAAVGARL